MIRKGFWISEATNHDRKLPTIILREVTERARIEAEMAARTQQEGAVADLSRQALAGWDLEWLFDKTDAAVAEALKVEFSKMLELPRSGDELVLRAGVGWPEGCVGVSRVPAREGTQVSYTLQLGEAALAEDLTRKEIFRVRNSPTGLRFSLSHLAHFTQLSVPGTAFNLLRHDERLPPKVSQGHISLIFM